MDPADITKLVQSSLQEVQSNLLNQMDNMMSVKLNNFQQQVQESQKIFSDVQIGKIELITSESYKFNKKGNEEQYKCNAKVNQKLKEAEASLHEQATETALEKISEGISMIEHRQKLIKLADSSELGWRTVTEYETSSIADDSEDEKKIWKAENRAQRKFKQSRRQSTFRGSRRTHPNAINIPEVQPNMIVDNGASKGQSTYSRRPGTCFGCGKPGHWRFECRESQRKLEDKGDKISIFNNNVLDETVTKKEFDTKQENLLSPVGRLKAAYGKWKEIGASDAVLNIVKERYKLPLFTLPEKADLANNKSARLNKSFVEGEICKLLKKGCISEVNERPWIINPLTVAENKEKQRLVLDCRHLNPHLYKFKFKYEDANVAKDTFKTGGYLFGFDLKSAYHHVEIFEDHRKYLGFAWDFDSGRRFFVFNVLPFGISTAGYVFTKVTRELIKYWRSQGENIIMFLDDGIGGGTSFEEAKTFSINVQQDLNELGFLSADEKCSWGPRKRLIWLGLVWDMEEGKVYITEQRIQKLLRCTNYVLEFVDLLFP